MARNLTENQAIRLLQKYLRQLSFFEERLPQLPIDGVFDSETQLAVEIFQELNGLEVTGVADRITWDLIYTQYRDSISLYAKPIPIDVFPFLQAPAAIRQGDIGFHVAAAQYMLRDLFLFYGDPTMELQTDGVYGEQTADAVRAFQGYADLSQTGEIDLNTWNRIAALYNDFLRRSNQ